MPPSLLLHSRCVVTKEQVSCDLKGEAAILHVKKGVYYSLDPVGARVWALLQQPRTVSEVRDALVREYDVSPQRCEHDLFVLLRELAAEGLIEVQGEDHVPAA
jgi:hypothetical protein